MYGVDMKARKLRKRRRVWAIENTSGGYMSCTGLEGIEHLLVLETKREALEILEYEIDKMPPRIAEQIWFVRKRWLVE